MHGVTAADLASALIGLLAKAEHPGDRAYLLVLNRLFGVGQSIDTLMVGDPESLRNFCDTAMYAWEKLSPLRFTEKDIALLESLLLQMRDVGADIAVYPMTRRHEIKFKRDADGRFQKVREPSFDPLAPAAWMDGM